MKQNCKNILPFIPLLADDALPKEKIDMIEKHLSVCPACRRELDLYCRIAQTTKELPSPTLSSGFHEKLMENIKKETANAPTPIARPWRRHIAGYAAAAAVIALSVVTYLGMPRHSIGNNPDDYGIATQQPAETDNTAIPAPQVTPSQAEPPATRSQVTPQSRGAQPRQSTPADDTMTYPTGPSTWSQVTPQENPPAQASSAPQVSRTTVDDESNQTFATYRVYVDAAHLADAEALLSDLAKDENGYRIETDTEPILKALSTLPGFHVGCVEDSTLTADYIYLISE